MILGRTAAPLSLKRTMTIVVALNGLGALLEIGVALAAGSVALFADSLDFCEDASIGVLVLAGLAWSAQARARLGMVLALVLLLPSVATLAMAWFRFSNGAAPAPLALSGTAAVAFAVNATCALLLARQRGIGGSLTKAAYLSARNDLLANIAIIGAGIATAWHPSRWPDLLVGLAIAVLNIGAFWEVWTAARGEAPDD